MSRIQLSQHDHVIHVEITRADKKNAMDDEMIDALIEAGAKISKTQARAVVLSGQGDCFCAGIDISGLTKMIGKDIDALIMPRTHGNGTTNRWQEVAMLWHRMEIPVIAALHGVAYGAGLQLAMGADVRIAAPDCKLSVMEMKWGIVPDMGGMVLLPRLVRADILRRLVYTATPIDAEQAERWGLVSELSADPVQAAMDLAQDIAQKGPNAVKAAKALIHIAETEAPNQVLWAESRAQADLLGQPEQMEVIAAQFAKRAPVFE
ncbi:MAG: crotonase/enoyl-CoA hydratase family protein [Roseobacter sp.]